MPTDLRAYLRDIESTAREAVETGDERVRAYCLLVLARQARTLDEICVDVRKPAGSASGLARIAATG